MALQLTLKMSPDEGANVLTALLEAIAEREGIKGHGAYEPEVRSRLIELVAREWGYTPGSVVVKARDTRKKG
jgi:hypothetical protein